MDLMQIHPEIRAYLAKIRDFVAPGPFADNTDQKRMQIEHVASIVSSAPTPGIETRNWFIGAAGREIPVRIYRPAPTGPKPLILFFHGGGWLMGSIDSHNYLAAALSEGTDSVVVSVHYRRTPENKHPAQIDDCYDALLWAVAKAEFLGIDANCIAVAGDSAGAHLATSCAIRARDQGGPRLAFQALIYPMIEPHFETESYLSFADAPGLSRADCIAFWQEFLGEDLTNPPPSAVPSANDLFGLPPAAIVTGEFDPLRDEGESYARKLSEAGVSVELNRAAGLIHGFMRAAPYSAAARAELNRIFSQLRRALHYSL